MRPEMLSEARRERGTPFGAMLYEPARADSAIRATVDRRPGLIGGPVVEAVATSTTGSRPPKVAPAQTAPEQKPEWMRLHERITAEFIRPALKENTPEGFRQFWGGHRMVDFRTLFHAFIVALAEAEANASLPDSVDVFGMMVHAAREVGDDDGEELVRAALLDVQLASGFVQQFESRDALDLDEDRNQAARHNIGSFQQNICGWCLAEAVYGDVRPNDDVLAEILIDLRNGAAMVYEGAKRGAELRGLAVNVDLGVVLGAWGRPCEAMFDYLALRAPDLLAKCIDDTSLSNGLRARAAMAAGNILSDEKAAGILMSALDASPPIVQEGCVYGLEKHRTPKVLEKLRALCDSDRTSPGVREAAREALEQS